MQEKLENEKPFNPQYFAIFCMERSSLLLRPSKKVSIRPSIYAYKLPKAQNSVEYA